jgi:hypothetical protein
VLFPRCAESPRFRFIENGVAETGETPADAASFRAGLKHFDEVNAN